MLRSIRLRPRSAPFGHRVKSERFAGTDGGLRHHYQPPRLRAFWEMLSAQTPRLAKAGTSFPLLRVQLSELEFTIERS